MICGRMFAPIVEHTSNPILLLFIIVVRVRLTFKLHMLAGDNR